MRRRSLLRCLAKRDGFSLVEVVLTLAIVAMSLLSVVGLFSRLCQSSADNTDRREHAEALDSLRGHLNESVGFTRTLAATQAASPDAPWSLWYLTYHADSDGNPDPAAGRVVSAWFETPPENISDYERARSGRWLRVQLSQAVPTAPGPDPALLLLKAEIRSTPGLGKSAPNSSLLLTTLAVRR